jgi:hypothetical protein
MIPKQIVSRLTEQQQQQHAEDLQQQIPKDPSLSFCP